ncbi:hypothetical protein V2J52_11195 [Georgenia sp. MJ173]|uniref:hypothetical protein n=1 Tax=Georgenia sunbinii TaxID=3117728 RepID=UPI002F260FA4
MDISADLASDAFVRLAYELYAIVPAEFVAARKARAATLRADDDKQAAARVAALPKATAAAWAVGAVVRGLPDEVDALSQLGAELRVAQASANATELRDLGRRRRRLTARVAAAAEALAADHDVALSAAALGQVTGTWHAVVIDRTAERAVRSGLLVRPLEPGAVDLGALALPGVVEDVPDDDELDAEIPEVGGGGAGAGAGAAPSGADAARSRADKAAARQAARDLAAAERAAATARDEVAEAEDEVERLHAAVLRAAAQVEEAERELAKRKESLALLDEQQDAAEEAHAAAVARSEEAERALTEARSRVPGEGS